MARDLALEGTVGLAWALPTFSVAFWTLVSERFPPRSGRLFCSPRAHDCGDWDLRVREDRRKRGREQNASKQPVLVSSASCFCVVAVPQMWAQSCYQLVDQCTIPRKATVWLFMVTLLPYESAFSVVSKNFSSKDKNRNPCLVIFMGSPVCFIVFMCCYKWCQVFQMTTSHFHWLPPDSIS